MSAVRAATAMTLVAASVCASAESEDARISAVYKRRIAIVSAQRLQQSVRTVASFGSRLAGSEGERKTLDWMESEFRALGLQNTRREPFKVTVPDPESTGTVIGKGWNVKVLPLWPNIVRTSTCDVIGPLLYGGNGSLEELSGKIVRGSIVVLEFSSGQNWRNASKLGAKAILFIEPKQTTRSEAEMKFAGVPLNAPRFWVQVRDSGPLLEAAFRGEIVHLQCRQDWVVRETYNLIGELPGTDSALSHERVLFSAHADAMCAVPSLAFGAESTCGLAALVELAHITKEHPARRPTTFMVTSAHGLALQGAREFIDRRIERDPWRMLLAVSLDLSSASSTLGAFSQGWFYLYRREAWDSVRDVSRGMRSHADVLAPILGAASSRLVLTDAVNDSDGRTWKNDMTGKFTFECEPFIQARYNALTFATIEDSRERFDTPFDTIDHVNFGNLTNQLKALSCFAYNLTNDTSQPGSISSYRVPLTTTLPQRMSLVGGFSNVNGRVVSFDPRKSFLPDVPVPHSLVVAMHRERALMGVRSTIVQMTEGEQARYELKGLAPATSWWTADRRPIHLTSMKLDATTGNIVFAANNSYLEGQDSGEGFLLTTVRKTLPIPVFECTATDLYDLVNPHDLKSLTIGEILAADSDAEPGAFGIYLYDRDPKLVSEVEDSAVIFLKPGYRWKLLMGAGYSDLALALVNANSSNPNGMGYLSPGGSGTAAPKGDDISLHGLLLNLPFRAASDLIALNQSRIKKFAAYRIIGPGVERLHQKAISELSESEAALQNYDYAGAERHAKSAWGYALSAYPLIRGTVDDVVLGVVFYLFLLIPFSYFLERLLFASRSLLRQLVMAMIVFFASFGILRLVHPAFEIVSNPTMIFVAFVMGALSLVVTGFVVGKFEASLKTLKALQSGVHEVDVGRVSVAMAAFNLGISNMRRRKARTLLTTLTLVVMTFIVLSFTSIVSDLQTMDIGSEAKASYPGILLRGPGLDPQEESSYRQLSNLFASDGTVVKRVWYYGAEVKDTSALTLRHADRIVEPRAILGLEAAESEVTAPQQALLPGGRWFRDGESHVMLLPSSLAEQLKIDPSDVGKASVWFAGQAYIVIGLLDDRALKSITDLDGDGIAPADFTLTSRFHAQSRTTGETFRKYLRLDPAVCFVLPASDTIALGGDLRSIAVKLKDFNATRIALNDLMPRIRLNLYAAVPGQSGPEVRMFSVRQGSKSTGMGLVFVQMLIASIFVFGTMAAGVYERTKEIGVLSAVGLAPNHIAILFFAESLVYGVMGAVLGYFLAQTVSRIVLATGILPGLYLNFSAGSAVLAAVVVIGVVLLSTIYPAKVAARIAAPALDQEMMSEPPDGDVWSVTLPFSVTKSEAVGLLDFLAEWFRAYEEYTIGDFVTTGTTLDRSQQNLSLSTTVWIAPYDLGVSQGLSLSAQPTPQEGIFRLELTLKRQSGDPENWVLVNKPFLAHLRQQFLTWQTLGAEERNRYMSAATAPAPSPAS